MKKNIIFWICLLSVTAISAQDLCRFPAFDFAVTAYNANNMQDALRFLRIAKLCKEKDEKEIQHWVEMCNRKLAQITQNKPTTTTQPDFVEQGDDFYNEGNYAKAFECYKKAADNGNTAGLFLLGFGAYYEEDKLPIPQKGWELMMKSAKQGYGLAQMWVGILLCGNDLDFKEGQQWLLKAAEQGYANEKACHFLAICFEEGCLMFDDDDNLVQTCEVDYPEAIKWYKKEIELIYQKKWK